jgi:hypothetical protein
VALRRNGGRDRRSHRGAASVARSNVKVLDVVTILFFEIVALIGF